MQELALIPINFDCDDIISYSSNDYLPDTIDQESYGPAWTLVNDSDPKISWKFFVPFWYHPESSSDSDQLKGK